MWYTFFMKKRTASYIRNFVFGVEDSLVSTVGLISYICSGTLIILPYLAFEGRDAIRYSIMIAVLSLFVLGFLSAKFARINPWRRAVQMVAIGGLAILIGTGG